MNGFDSAATQYENRTPEDCGWFEEPEEDAKPSTHVNREPVPVDDFDPFLEKNWSVA